MKVLPLSVYFKNDGAFGAVPPNPLPPKGFYRTSHRTDQSVAGTLRVIKLPKLGPFCTCYTVSFPLYPQTAVRSVQYQLNAYHTRVFTAPANVPTGALTGTLVSLLSLMLRRHCTYCTSAFFEQKRKRSKGLSLLPGFGTGSALLIAFVQSVSYAMFS